MLQRCTNPTGGSITAADTAAHVMPAKPALFVYFSTPSTNVGNITISDAAGITGGNLTGGIVIPKGTTLNFPIGPILKLESLAYQSANANDVLNYLVVG